MRLDPNTLTPSQVRSFLTIHGWEKIGEAGAGETWRLPGHEEAPDLLLPAKVDALFPQALQSVLSRLAWVTHLREAELVDAIRDSTSDALEVVVRDPTTRTGRISLRRGMLLARALYEVVQNGVRVVYLGGRPSYFGGLSEDAARVLDDMVLLPPRVGSFRLVMLSPVAEVLAFDPELVPVDPHRRALTAALAALEATRSAAEAGLARAEPADVEPAVEQGMSGQLLRAIASLDTQSTALRVDFRGRFASDRSLGVPEHVSLGSQHFSQLNSLRTLVTRLAPREGYLLQGWVKNVGVEEPLLEKTISGTVIVEAKIDGRPREVHVALEEEAFQRAATGIGRIELRARGRLEKVGKHWHLTHPEGVRITQLGDS